MTSTSSLLEEENRRRWPIREAARRLLILLACGICVWLVAAAQRQHRQTRLTHLQLERWDRRVALEQQLESEVTLSFGKPVPLGEWLDEWSRQSGIKVTPHLENNVALAGNGCVMVRLDLLPVSAREALQALCELEIAHWALADDSIVMLVMNPRSSDRREPVEVEMLQLPPLLVAQDRNALFDVFVQCCSWDEQRVDDRWEYGIHAGAIVGNQFHDVHLRDVQFFDRLNAAKLQAAELNRFTDPDHSALRPVLLTSDPADSDLLRSLEGLVEFEQRELPLAEFVAKLSEQTGRAWFVDREEIANTGRSPDIRVQVCNGKLRHVLGVAFGDNDLGAIPFARGRSIKVTFLGEAYGFHRLLPVAYPVKDFSPASQTLIHHVIRRMVAPDSWQQNHHWSGSCDARFFAGLLVTNAPLAIHSEVSDLLETLRQVRSGQLRSPARAGQESAASRQLRARCAQRQELSILNQSLGDVLRNLRDRRGLPIHLNLDGVHIDLDENKRLTFFDRGLPLLDSLNAMLEPLELMAVMKPERLEVVARDYVATFGTAVDVHDLRSLIRGRGWTHGDVVRAIERDVAPQSWSRQGYVGDLVFVDDLLIVRNEPAILDDVAVYLRKAGALPAGESP